VLAQFCNFGGALETMLRDHHICGINNEAIQHHLLVETKLILKKAFELAQGMEAAVKNVCEMQGNAQAATRQSEDVHAVSCKKTEFICYRCGQSGYGPSNCAFRAAQCCKCGKVGHIKKMCQSKKTPRGGGASNTRNNKPPFTHAGESSLPSHMQERTRTPSL